MTKEVLLAIGVAAAANLVALVGAARNRTGQPEASIELSERELRLNHASENYSARWATLQFQHRPEWIGEQQLQALGFSLSAERKLPREGFVALEFDPQARVGHLMSRLAPVDADPDPKALRARWPDRGRVLILRAVFRVTNRFPPRGEVAFLVPRQVAVPAGWVRGLGPVHLNQPRFAIRLAVGPNYEPFAAAFRLTSPLEAPAP